MWLRLKLREGVKDSNVEVMKDGGGGHEFKLLPDDEIIIHVWECCVCYDTNEVQADLYDTRFDHIKKG